MIFTKTANVREPQAIEVKDVHVAWRTSEPVEDAEHNIVYLQDVIANPMNLYDAEHRYRWHPLPSQDAGTFNALVDLAMDAASGQVKAKNLLFIYPQKNNYPAFEPPHESGHMSAEHLLQSLKRTGVDLLATERLVAHPAMPADKARKMMAQIDEAREQQRREHRREVQPTHRWNFSKNPHYGETVES